MKEDFKYLKVEEYIKTQFLSGEIKVGSQIMTEKQLCEKFDVSRMTINKAVLNLVKDGFIQRIAGKGSFVLNPHITKPIQQSTSFTQDMESIGLKAGSKLIEYRVFRGEQIPLAAEKLRLGADDLIHYFVRLRTGNGSPIAISYTYVSSLAIPALDVTVLEGSFYDYVKKSGIEIKGIIAEMTAVMATEEQQKLLGVGSVALLKNAHITLLSNDEPFEYIETYYIGTRYSYKFNSSYSM